MAINAESDESSLDRYTAAVRSIWGDGKDPQLPYRVKGLLEKHGAPGHRLAYALYSWVRKSFS